MDYFYNNMSEKYDSLKRQERSIGRGCARRRGLRISHYSVRTSIRLAFVFSAFGEVTVYLPGIAGY